MNQTHAHRDRLGLFRFAGLIEAASGFIAGVGMGFRPMAEVAQVGNDALAHR
jgi:hypothetical protein